MRILRFYTDDGTVHLGIREGDEVRDLGPRSAIALMNGAAPPPTLRRLPAQGLRLDAPLRESTKLLALAGNYRKHIAEGGGELVDAKDGLTPQVFWKPPGCINSPGGVIAIRQNNVFVDWEIELAVIIGQRASRVREEDAMSHVFGYTIINDVSERKFNADREGRKPRAEDTFFDWLMGKWFDGFAPMGPEIVTVDEIPDPHDLPLRLWVNGELMQDSRTSYMIFSIPETIAYISAVTTLEPGDIISMGTPEGVGLPRGIALEDGDTVRAEIDPIGALVNVIRKEP